MSLPNLHHLFILPFMAIPHYNCTITYHPQGPHWGSKRWRILHISQKWKNSSLFSSQKWTKFFIFSSQKWKKFFTISTYFTKMEKFFTYSSQKWRQIWLDRLCVTQSPQKAQKFGAISEPFGQWLLIRSPAPKFGAQWGPWASPWYTQYP